MSLVEKPKPEEAPYNLATHGAYIFTPAIIDCLKEIKPGKDGELWLVNATITGDGSIRVAEEDKTRNRKLLAKRKEIEALMAAKLQGQTIVPLELLTHGRYIKLRIAAGRGKKKYDKRETIKRRDQERSNEAELRPSKTSLPSTKSSAV